MLKKEKYRTDKDGKRKNDQDDDEGRFKKKKTKNNADEVKAKERKMMIKDLKTDLKDEEKVAAKGAFKANVDLLEKVFYIYFKVLCKNNAISKFYKDSLNGLLKHVHKINVDLIWSILDRLKDSCQKLRYKEDQQDNRLLCIVTMNNILQGPAKDFQMDDLCVLTNLYTFLKDTY